ncbi:MAG: DUF1911 domain-containing protein [Rhizobacter sp.]|nr:DUF1911 domain-containing protein [Rhizobacter sp.]
MKMLVRTAAEFSAKVRCKLLNFMRYEEEAADLEIRIPRTTKRLADPAWRAEKNVGELQAAAGARAEYALNLATINYSAGASPELIANDYPALVTYWEEFGHLHEAFHKSDIHHGAVVPHAALPGGDGYYDALRLISFAYLFGHTREVPRVKTLLDYGNVEKDCLIERLLQPFGLAVDPLPDDSTRELPYRNTIKIFDAAPSERPALMKRYLEKWYEASRREYYHGTHEGSAVFLGYWSFEAGAITYLLDIDDSSYRDHEFYPRDLVDYARSLPRPAALGSDGKTLDVTRLRCAASQPCPRNGFWFTPAQANSRRYFKQGDLMPDVGGDFGVTIWQLDQNQDPPRL